jgi:hypothetical protein
LMPLARMIHNNKSGNRILMIISIPDEQKRYIL